MLTALSLVGCLFIGYLAIASLRQTLAQKADAVVTASTRGSLWKGFAIGLSNPKDILFFVAFFPQFIQVTTDTSHSLLLLSLLWTVMDLAILSLYILLTSKLATPQRQRLISLTSGIVLLLIAAAGLLYNLHVLWP
ncbi:leucine export protein LeuE [compost metagenome]